MLSSSPTPLSFKEVKAGLKKAEALVTSGAAKTTDDDILAALDSMKRGGGCHTHLSGKDGVDRYWDRDEVKVYREALDRVAVKPLPMKKLVSALGKEAKGTDASFLEGVLRDAVRDGVLHQHPPAKADSEPTYGIHPPPPWYTTKAYKKPFDGLMKAVERVVDVGEVSLDQVMDAVREQMANRPAPVVEAPPSAEPPKAAEPNAAPEPETDTETGESDAGQPPAEPVHSTESHQ